MLTIGLVILVALAVSWTVGSLALRAGGLLCLAVGTALALTGTPAGALLIAPGALAWLTGHWLYGLRHHTCRSPLARRIYTQLLPRRLDPTRGRGCRPRRPTDVTRPRRVPPRRPRPGRAAIPDAQRRRGPSASPIRGVDGDAGMCDGPTCDRFAAPIG